MVPELGPAKNRASPSNSMKAASVLGESAQVCVVQVSQEAVSDGEAMSSRQASPFVSIPTSTPVSRSSRSSFVVGEAFQLPPVAHDESKL